MSRRLALFAVLAVSAAGCVSAAPTPCDGLSTRTYGITREEYAPCAREILDTLDALQRQVRRVVYQKDGEAAGEAGRASRYLRLLQERVGVRADLQRELRAGSPAPTIERWPDGVMRRFIEKAFNAAAQYRSALGHPNRDNLDQGFRYHQEARQAYARFR